MSSVNYARIIREIHGLTSRSELLDEPPLDICEALAGYITSLGEDADWGFWVVFKNTYRGRIEQQDDGQWLLDKDKSKSTTKELVYKLENILNVRCRMRLGDLEKYIYLEKLWIYIDVLNSLPIL